MELTVEKTGLLSGKKHLFTFRHFEGRLSFDPAEPVSSSVEIAIDSRSIECHDAWLSSKDLRKVQEYANRDMLASERFPRLSFRSAKVSRPDGTQTRIEGLLTIRDATKQVRISTTLVEASGQTLSFYGRAELRLTDFGLKPPKAALGAIGTKDEMVFEFAITAVAAHDASFRMSN